ncbi:unnamed protein product [Mytilus coruscus]|uniref:Uncharacterized protein n=1 Tax=Mytilus coruscus TaxID=42192 RepID=A0A6J8BDR0_MYTCO|nr:unnamed protein product [Mytilus coruscus]
MAQSCCKKVVRAALVFPFTAGRPSKAKSDSNSQFEQENKWTQFFVDVYVTAEENVTPCSADNRTSIDNKCYAAEVFEVVRPYCHPIELEYSLLSMIFLAELWPAQKQSKHLSSDLERGHENRSVTTDFASIVDSISQPLEHSIAIEEFTNNSNDRENLLFLGLENSFSSYSVICVVSGILFCAPKFVIGFLLKSESKSPSNYSNFEIQIYTKSSIIELSYFSYDIVLIQTALVFNLILVSTASLILASVQIATYDRLAGLQVASHLKYLQHGQLFEVVSLNQANFV